jgi:general secretion pathway protein F
MQSATLDDFTAWNEQLVALAAAGVPLEVGLGRLETDAAATLNEINATVARRVKRGESLVQSLDDDEPLAPRSYRALVQSGLRSGGLSATLDGSSRLAESIDESRNALRAAIFYPLVVCCLAYLGFVAFCLFFVPILEEMYYDLRVPADSALRVLHVVRETLPYWVAVPPLALLVWYVWQRRVRSRRSQSLAFADGNFAWLPGMSTVVFQQRCANFAETAASLLERGISLPESVRLAASASGEARLIEGADSFAAGLDRNELPADHCSAARRFPPFLRWALWHSESTIGRDRALRMAVGIYRRAAQRRAERLRLVAPMIVGVVLGGGAVLLYGLALFLPVVQMLRTLAS